MTIKWSFSSLKEYVNCPRQYHETKVLQNFTKQVTAQMRYGTEVHKALEDYTRDRTELPLFYKKYQPQIDALLLIPGERYVEYKMALNEDITPCDFSAPDYYVRGIVDLLIVDGDVAFIVDYKTGSAKYPDSKQLALMALMTFAHFTQVQRIKAGLLFVAHNVFIPQDYARKDVDNLLAMFKKDLVRLEHSFKENAWPPNPTPLCGWCPVTTCEFNKG